MHVFSSAFALLSILPLSLAAPTQAAPFPEVTPPPSANHGDHVNIQKRQLKGKLRGHVVSLDDSSAIDIKSAEAAADTTKVQSALEAVTPTTRPTAISDVLARQSSIWAGSSTRTDFYQAIATQIADGAGPLLGDTLDALLTGGLPVGENSINNANPAPPTKIYPKADPNDAPYSLSEAALRKAIFIPSTFTYGAIPPAIFVPGTGSYGGVNFENNLRKLLTGSSIADPIWLNIPGAQLADVQTNAEYIAYAISYISSLTSSRNISMITWSQGGLDTQWVFKYWPSTRPKITDFLPISPDFRGTVLANALCLSANSDFGLNPCPPAVIQQQATSDLIRTLRSDGGDSAYVPTTTFYSGFFDEIVEPQQGTAASAYMLNARNVGVSNNEVQKLCFGYAAGGFYGHAGVLFHPLTYALIVDALTHDGPGDLSRIDVASVCSEFAAPGLDVDDVIATSALIPVAGVLLLGFPDRRFLEPRLRAYV